MEREHISCLVGGFIVKSSVCVCVCVCVSVCVCLYRVCCEFTQHVPYERVEEENGRRGAAWRGRQ